MLIICLLFLVRNYVKANPSASKCIPEKKKQLIQFAAPGILPLFAALVFRKPHRTPSLRGTR